MITLKTQLDVSRKQTELLERKLEQITDERNKLAFEITDLSGTLFEQSHKLIEEAHNSQKIAEQELEVTKQNASVLKIENESLKRIIKRQNQRVRLSLFSDPVSRLNNRESPLISGASEDSVFIVGSFDCMRLMSCTLTNFLLGSRLIVPQWVVLWSEYSTRKFFHP